jgi:hypothetical protein
VGSFVLQVVGLVALMADTQAAMWIGVTVPAYGAGLITLARPYLVARL